MNTRIQQFLQTEQITPAKLADTLGVQRSNISHILTGRNKPSFDFIEKMLKKYPQLNSDWLILGKGNMFRDSQQNNPVKPDLFSNTTPVNIADTAVNTPTINQPTTGIEKEQKIPITNNSQSKSIVRVMVFYNDNTFETYNPS